MTRTPSPRADGALTLDDLRALGIRPEDVDEEWMDEMVKRLFHELRRQLSQLETAKDSVEQAGRRATNVRTLVSLERTLERLARLEQERALSRETKVAAGNDDAVAALERRLDQLLAAGGAPPPSKEPQQ
jgi:predicted FMN-binding regulatory protein PaiB